LGPILSTLWHDNSTPVFFQPTHNKWISHNITKGVFQGECLSTALFAISLKRSLAHFRELLSKINLQSQLVYTLAYIDDVILVCNPSHFSVIWPLWKQALAASGLEVQQAKCHSWVLQSPEILPLVNDVVEQVPSEQHGLPPLGSAAQGEYKTFLSIYSVGIQRTIKGSAKAANPAAIIRS
jgi:hypothetical protein